MYIPFSAVQQYAPDGMQPVTHATWPPVQQGPLESIQLYIRGQLVHSTGVITVELLTRFHSTSCHSHSNSLQTVSWNCPPVLESRCVLPLVSQQSAVEAIHELPQIFWPVAQQVEVESMQLRRTKLLACPPATSKPPPTRHCNTSCRLCSNWLKATTY